MDSHIAAKLLHLGSPRLGLQGGLPRLRVLLAGLVIAAWWAISALHTGFALFSDLHSLGGARLQNLLRERGFLSRGGLTSHVRVVIRAHPKDTELIKSLVWNLRGQTDKLSWLQADFVLVPTEPGSLEALRSITGDLQDGTSDMKVLDLDDEWFEKNETPLRFQCTEQDRKGYAYTGMHKVKKICDYANYQYYLATDAALKDTIDSCDICTHILVTNGDNSYAPGFFEETLTKKKDIVLTDFAHERESVRGGTERGHLDLGGVIFKKSVLRGGAHTFLKGLPDKAKALEVHDADYWFVQKALMNRASYTIVHKLLFYHH